jgi:hypothetical protein
MSMESLAQHSREIGQVVGVTGSKVTVQIHEDTRGAVHSYPGGQATVAQIGAYLGFPVGAGEMVVGVLTGAYQEEG